MVTRNLCAGVVFFYDLHKKAAESVTAGIEGTERISTTEHSGESALHIWRFAMRMKKKLGNLPKKIPEVSTRSGGRTRTPLRALDFESSASTNSAIRA